VEEPARKALHTDLCRVSQRLAHDWRVALFDLAVLAGVLTSDTSGVGVFSVAGPIVKSTGSIGLLLVYWLLAPIIALGWSSLLLVV